MYAQSRYDKEDATLKDLGEVAAELNDIEQRQHRVLGSNHPSRKYTLELLESVRDMLAHAMGMPELARGPELARE